MKPKAQWLNSTVLGIGMASLFSDLSHETVTSVLPSLLASFGLAAGALGTVEGVADGLSSAAKLYGGWLTDRIARRKPLCAAGYAGMAVATGLMALATNWGLVLLGRGLAWVARGLRTPARKALLAEAVTPETYGRAFGFERTMDTLGAVLAPLVTLALLASGLKQQPLLWLAVLPALLSVLAVVFWVQETPDRTPDPRPFLASMQGLPRPFIRLLGAMGLFGAGDFAHSLMILYAVKVLSPSLGMAQAATISVGLYALHNAVYAATSYPAGILADRMDKRTLLAGGYLLGALSALLMALGVDSLPLLALLFVLGGTYLGIEETLEDTLAAERLPTSLRGTGFGSLAVVNGLGDFVSSLSVGWLWATLGPGVGFGSAALLMMAGAIGVRRT
ncbi:MFS transporter [Anthocerotibacter panamensis]|uniref:MFS transporter n=1 Tax=Anthocerotibacter panamensis TaxID=2857077 RepID=UPI001C40711D|nr:MFS transporter [Anthocerotibacter panamensis]